MKCTLFRALSLLFFVTSIGFAGDPDKPESSTKSITSDSPMSTSTDNKQPKAGDEPLSILKSDAVSGGTFMKVRWTPSANVGAYVFLSEEEIEVGYDESGHPWTFVGYAPYKTFRYADQDPEVVFTNLNPGRKYFYAILPEDDPEFGNGLVIPHYRVAKTANRGVHVTATKIHMIDDSDDFSDGEVAFTFQLLSTNVHPKEAEPTDLFDAVRWPALTGDEGAGDGYMTFCSGGTAYPSVDLFQFGIGDEVRFAVSCYDDDVDGVYDVAPMPEAYEYTGAFNVDHGEANANFWTFDIDGGTFETDTEDSEDYSNMELFQYKLIRKVPGNDITCLEFEIHLTVSVFYFAD